jgi:uncharacterized protein (TIGR03435 family)
MNSVGLRRLPDGITARQETVHSLVISAYGVLPYQIVGGPDWMKSDRFEIAAKAGADVPVAQIQLMMQSLLEDRFKLTADDLVIDPGGRGAPVYSGDGEPQRTGG